MVWYVIGIGMVWYCVVLVWYGIGIGIGIGIDDHQCIFNVRVHPYIMMVVW
jgi:hypothetical protein